MAAEPIRGRPPRRRRFPELVQGPVLAESYTSVHDVFVKPHRIALVPLMLLAGCFGGDEDTDTAQTPREVANAWVRALNDGDYAKACEVSFPGGKVCVGYLRWQPFGKGLRIQGFTLNSRGGGREKASFGVSTAIQRRDAQRQGGWTAYAPLDAFSIIERKDDLRVYWNPAEIVVAEGMLPCNRGFRRADWRRRRGPTGRSIAACHWFDDASRAELVRVLGKPDDRRGRFLGWQLDSAQAGIGPTAWFLEVTLTDPQGRVAKVSTQIRPV